MAEQTNEGFVFYQPLQLIPRREEMTQQYLEIAKRLKIQRVFFSSHGETKEEYAHLAAVLRDRMILFSKEGIKVGYWYAPTMGWNPVMNQTKAHPYQEIEDGVGRVSHGISCPLDEAFCRNFEENLAEIARSGVDCIMLEDDYRLQLHSGGFNCFCPLHMARFYQETGCTLTKEEIVEKVLSGEPNSIRTKWLEVAGKGLLELSRRLEQAVHRVNPVARLGLTAVMSHYSTEGFTMQQLLKAFSGDTKPFLRTIGAPYWSRDSYHPAWITEFTLLQKHWLRDMDLDLMAEGDPYPHSSFLVSSSDLIGFVQGLIAGGFPGMLVYPQSYDAPPLHDPAYIERLERDQLHFKLIRRIFPEEGIQVGVTPVETQNNFRNLTLEADFCHTKGWAAGWPDEPSSLHVLSRMGIPMAYDSATAPVVLFGYGARGYSDEQLTQLLSRGAVVDGPAAKWLMERGFDVGLLSIERTQLLPAYEHVVDHDHYGPFAEDLLNLACNDSGVYFQAMPRGAARVLSYYMEDLETLMFPSAIHYESGGNRICILPVDMQRAYRQETIQTVFSYPRAHQLASSLAWVGRKPLEVFVSGVPNLHVIARRNSDGSLSVMLQNGGMDSVENPTIVLDGSIPVSGSISLLGHEAQRVVVIHKYRYRNDERYGYLTLPNTTIPPMGAVFVRISY